MADPRPRGGLRCHHCAGPLSKDMETSDWNVSPLIRDSFSMIGSAVGGTASAFYGFNHVMPIVRRWVKGPMWLHFLIGAPPVIVFSSACAGLAGGAVPALAQLASSSYHAAVSSPLPPSASQDDKIHKSRTSSTLGYLMLKAALRAQNNSISTLIEAGGVSFIPLQYLGSFAESRLTSPLVVRLVSKSMGIEGCISDIKIELPDGHCSVCSLCVYRALGISSVEGNI